MFFSEKNYNLENILEGEVILINKPYKWSSFDVVKKIRSRFCKNFNLRKKWLTKKIQPQSKKQRLLLSIAIHQRSKGRTYENGLYDS